MVGWTLEERAAKFNTIFKDVKITRGQLCWFYRRNRISKKVVVNTKLFTPKAGSRQLIAVGRVVAELRRIKGDGLPMVYCDEVMFTRRAVMK